MRGDENREVQPDHEPPHMQDFAPVIIASMLRPQGATGVQTHAQQLSRYLEANGTTVTLVTPFSWGRLLKYPVFGFRLILTRCSASAGVAWYRQWHEVFLRNALRRRLAGADDCVVYAQGPLEARAALRVTRGSNRRVILAVHYPVSQADQWCNTAAGPIRREGLVFRGIRRAERTTVPTVDGIVYVSDWARQAVSTWLPEATEVPSAIVPNFLSPLQHEPSDAPLRDLVSTGTLDVMKNHRFLLKVLAAARLRGRSLTLDIIGNGPLRSDLLEMARSLGLDSQVRFLGFRRDVRDFLPNYRLYVHSSYTETSSLAIIEAMCAGLPILAAPVGGVPELFDDGVEGRYWSLDDPARAAAILIDLLENEPERLAAAKAARDRFSRQFDANVVVPRLLAFLRAASSPSADWAVPPMTRSARRVSLGPRVG
jgi:glycosyltransferase involved in cell wall biosynthesis